MKRKENKKNEENIREKELTKEQIIALKEEKKRMQEELDELQGRTTGGRLLCALAFLGILALFAGIFIGIVKLNVGNFASDVLAPVICETPVLRSILPSDLQKKTPKEIQAEKKAVADAKAAKKAAKQAAQDEAAEEAAAEQAIADQQAEQEAEAEQALADQEAAEKEAADEEELAAEQAAEEAALADYVNTYSEMQPKKAAQVFENMMTDQSDLVVKILTNMTPDNRAAIISNMSVNSATKLTVLMEQ